MTPSPDSPVASDPQPVSIDRELVTDPVAATLQAATAGRRLKGKIPSLPKEKRDAINALLLDGATYSVVIQRMAEQGVELNHENLSNWYQTGYQNFLAHLERSDYQRARYEAATDLLRDTDTSRLPQAGLQTAAAQIYDLLGRFAPAALANNIDEDPDKYTRVVNSLSRLARETLALQKYQDACARARDALLPMKDPKRKLSDAERRAIVLHVDHILGLDDDDQSSPEPDSETPSADLSSVSSSDLSGPSSQLSSKTLSESSSEP